MKDWRKIDGYPGYFVSNQGDIKSYRNFRGQPTPRVLTQRMNNSGYRIVDLHRDGKSSTRLVHRLVAEAFIPRVGDRNCVNHKDGCRQNSDASNLEWVTHKENLRHAIDALGAPIRRYHKLTLEQASAIKSSRGNIYVVGAMYGVSGATVSRIKNGLIWKDA